MTGGRHRTRSALAAAALVLVTGLSACGFSADADVPTTSRRGTDRAPATTKVRPPSPAKVGDALDATELAGRTSNALRSAGTVRLSVSTGGRTLTGELDVRSATPAYRLLGGSGADAVEVRYVGKVVYLGGPEFSAVAGGRRYLEVRPGGTDGMSRMLGPLLRTLEQAADPSALVSRLGDLRAKVVKVDGDRATYAMKVSAAQLEKATEALLGEPLPAQALQRLKPVTVEQTVDRDGRLVTARQLGGADGDVTVAYSDYGADVSIRAPAAGDVGRAD